MSYDITPPSGPAPGPTRNSPIADLSYRNYTGPIQPHAIRWWIIARQGIKTALAKKGMLAAIIISAIPYLFAAFALYLGQNVGQVAGADRFASAFFSALTLVTPLALFAITLNIGASSIAADNQANALLVYLSKPITKGDYLLGKWMSMFMVLFLCAFAPILLLYLFCLLMFSGQGFPTNLIVGGLLAALVPAVVHSSVMVGISAWSKTGRAAGGAYAGAYFGLPILLTIIVVARHQGNMMEARTDPLAFFNIDGIIKGLAQHFYDVHNILGMETPAPPFLPILIFGIVISVAGVLAARAKIRAVEVIRG